MNALAPPPEAAAQVVDVAVIGAGPAGANAALAAAEAGASLALVDEAPAAGGQVWRAPPPGWPELTGAEGAAGEALRRRVGAGAIKLLLGHRLWSIARLEPGPFRIDLSAEGGPRTLLAERIVAAMGTTERVVPFPGWTLPGVIGLAAATILLKAWDTLPGRRTVVAGAGPLLLAVAAGIVRKGGTVAAVVDLSSRSEWLGVVPALATRPDLAARGARWWAAVAPRVPILHRHGVRIARGATSVEAVEVGPVDAAGAPVGEVTTFQADSLAVGHGLVPASELTRLLRARHVFDRALGGWRPDCDADGRTSVPGLYVAGDGAGVRGVDAAVAMGRRAGAAAAGAPPRADRDRAVVGRAMSRLTALRPAMVAAVPHDAVVCRCEDVTRGAIDEAVGAGARDVNQLKHFTRCGMGPCQGRMCADVAAELLAVALAGRTDATAVDAARVLVGQWTGRTPLRPVPLEDLVGDYTYADIPVPPPAPL
ncbi:NAD(P)/FAD-dependent oxidoreductase [Acuticoccus sp.]|uniref:FAD/NAD(P)-dependent oxidoreductase n=1 Tax=Acuticoccus sp. TaxID=1904378 RepID=UPI003B52DC40